MAVKILLTFASIFLAQFAHACMPGKNIDVYFPSNSSAVTASEMLRLGSWMVDQRLRYPKQQAIIVSGYAEEREHNAKSLAEMRLHAVTAILTERGFNQVSIQEHSGVYKSDDVKNGRRVEITMLPACPNDCCPDHEPIEKR